MKIALYWAAACGGCEVSILEIGEHILKVAEAADIVFWPVALDFKYKDVEEMPDKHIDACLFNGAIRTSENEHIAKLLRAKSKILIAYGSCAVQGGIPGLANLKKREDILNRVYKETPTTDNLEGIFPQTEFEVSEGILELSKFNDHVKTLAQVVDVDYFIPGCPPVGEQVWTGIQTLISGKLPAKGSYLGCGDRALCDECPRKKEKKKIKKIYRSYEIVPNMDDCLLEQGLLCMGPATREGCGVQCIKANMPCIGCYGPPPEVKDQGVKMLSSLASIIDANDEKQAKKILEDVIDPVGAFYYFGLANSILKRAKQ